MVAHRLLGEPTIHFVICGEGSARARLETQAAGLTNVRFAPLQPAEALNDLLNAADIHLLVQRSHAADLVMPSKLSGMLGSGKPVIATAEPDTELARVMRQVGLLVPPGDLDAICHAIQQLASQPELRRALGSQGRRYALEHCDQQPILERLEAALRQLVQEHTA